MLGLTDQEIEFFNANGFVGPFDLYAPEEAPLRWNQALIEMVVSQHKPHNSTVINYDRHLDCDTLSAHISRPEIIWKLRSLIGDDILCWKSNIFKKDPGDTGTGWHQVETFIVGETTTSATPSLTFTEHGRFHANELTAWTAMSDVRAENGCLRFVAGSHKRWYYDENKQLVLNQEGASKDFFGYDYAELKLDQEWNPDQENVVNMEMKAGQFVLFTEKCVHGSLPNVSDATRMGYASRYVPPSVKVYENVAKLEEFGDSIDLGYHGCVLVSGEDEYGYNRLHQRSLNGFEFGRIG